MWMSCAKVHAIEEDAIRMLALIFFLHCRRWFFLIVILHTVIVHHCPPLQQQIWHMSYLATGPASCVVKAKKERIEVMVAFWPRTVIRQMCVWFSLLYTITVDQNGSKWLNFFSFISTWRWAVNNERSSKTRWERRSGTTLFCTTNNNHNNNIVTRSCNKHENISPTLTMRSRKIDNGFDETSAHVFELLSLASSKPCYIQHYWGWCTWLPPIYYFCTICYVCCVC